MFLQLILAATLFVGVALSYQQSSSGQVSVTDAELLKVTEEIWSKETANLQRFVTANLQGKTKSSKTDDSASDRLLTVNEVVFTYPSIEKLRKLYDNYELDTLTDERTTSEELQEQNDFLNQVFNTPVIQTALEFLRQKGVVTSDRNNQYNLLKSIFTPYSRGSGRVGSSGFEHIFMAETKKGDVMGLHNWVYFYELEKQGLVDYQGYMNHLDLGTKGSIVKYRFSMGGQMKPTNAIFVGTTPELELALYTICFQTRANQDCPVSVGGKTFNIKSYSFTYKGENLIGSAYPDVKN